MLSFFDFGRKKREARQRDERAALRASQDAEQLRLGQVLLVRLREAATQNPNVGNGSTLHVWGLMDNGGKYSVVVQLKDDYGTHTMAQFNVWVSHDDLYSLYGPYGTDEHFPLAEFEHMAEKACERVRTLK